MMENHLSTRKMRETPIWQVLIGIEYPHMAKLWKTVDSTKCYLRCICVSRHIRKKQIRMGREKIKRVKYPEGYIKPLDIVDITGFPLDSKICLELYKDSNIIWKKEDRL